MQRTGRTTNAQVHIHNMFFWSRKGKRFLALSRQFEPCVVYFLSRLLFPPTIYDVKHYWYLCVWDCAECSRLHISSLARAWSGFASFMSAYISVLFLFCKQSFTMKQEQKNLLIRTCIVIGKHASFSFLKAKTTMRKVFRIPSTTQHCTNCQDTCKAMQLRTTTWLSYSTTKNTNEK